MAANFPNSPTDGQTYSFGGTNYVYSTTNGGWKAFIGVGQLLSIQVFTASGTYTPTSGMEYCQIECVGAGAGGGSSATSSAGSFGIAGGGGGGAYARKLAASGTIGASQTVTVGVGSAGGVAGNNAGSAVTNDTSVGSICIAKKGQPGLGSVANTAGSGGAGGLASSSTGDLRLSGGTGATGSQGSIITIVGGIGGSGGHAGNGFGQGGIPTYTGGGVGQPATGNGGGGGAGGSYNGGASGAGGVGTDGIVIITEFTRSSPVPGVASSTDNAIVRFDGTAGRVQNSGLTLNDADSLVWTVGASQQLGAGDSATIIGLGGLNAYLGTTNFAALQLRSDSAGTSGPYLLTYHNSASPANADIVGGWSAYGRDSGAVIQEYGAFNWIIDDTTAGSEDSHLNILTYTAAATSAMGFYPGGIKWPASAIASSDANTCDDYEEGTFTPAYVLSTPGTSSFTHAAQTGRYTKIGRLVTVSTAMATSAFSLGSGTGNVRISGLPFTVGTAGDGVSAVVCTLGWSAAASTPYEAMAQAGQTYMRLFKHSTSPGISVELVQTDPAAGATTNETLVTSTYTI